MHASYIIKLFIIALAAVLICTFKCEQTTHDVEQFNVLTPNEHLYAAESAEQDDRGLYFFPELTKRLNQPAFIADLRKRLSAEGIDVPINAESTSFYARGFSGDIPSQVSVECRIPVPGYDIKDFFGHSAGIDLEAEEEIRSVLREMFVAMIHELNEEE